MSSPQIYTPRHRVRFVTATALFDGHDASINIVRRLLQRAGAEVVHLGHNRSVAEIADAAIQEDVQAVAVSSYQGGHNEFFRYLVGLLRERGAGHVRVFGGGGGVIVPDEIQALEACGVTRIYSPEDGRRLGLQGMINDMLERADFPLPPVALDGDLSCLTPRNVPPLARLITQAERNGAGPPLPPEVLDALEGRAAARRSPVVGITGTGGAGKSSLADELIRRLLRDAPQLHIGVLSVDPSKRRTGGALLGDRIRLNAIHPPRVYVRCLATRGSGSELSEAVRQAIQVLRAAGFDLIFVETSGIGQGDSAVVDVSDLSLYVMTPDYGAPSQLEKIDMLDLADLVAVNKFDRRGGEDALRAVRRQVRRSRDLPRDLPDARLPIFGTVASQFNDVGVTALYLALLGRLEALLGRPLRSSFQVPGGIVAGDPRPILPERRSRYLGEIAETV
ncbi:cobalamin B12-binding domain-containing protein, partial [bacterium]|nr:cobalamin B12-binding domain-containing protein [bacterium]